MATDTIKGVSAPAKVNGVSQANIAKLLGTVFTTGAVVAAALALDFVTATINPTTGAPDADSGTTALSYIGETDAREWMPGFREGDNIAEADWRLPGQPILGYKPTNFLHNTDDLTNTNNWSNQNIVAPLTKDKTDPDGGTNAWRIESSGGSGDHRVRATTQGLKPNGVDNRLCFATVAKKISGTTTHLYMSSFRTGTDATAIFDLTNGTTYIATAGGDVVASTVNLGDDWYLCLMCFLVDTGSVGSFGFQIGITDSTTAKSSSIPSGNAADIYQPRITWDAGSKDYVENPNNRGTRVWGARAGTDSRKPVTNHHLYPMGDPSDFDTSTPDANVTFTDGQADLFGGNNAWKAIEGSTGAESQHYFHMANPTTRDSSTLYTYSGYAKAAERSEFRIYLREVNASISVSATYFNVASGSAAVGTVGSSMSDAGVAEVPGSGGWYRWWVTCSGADGSSDYIRIHLTGGGEDITYDGDGSSGMYFCGFNIVEGFVQDYVGAHNLIDDDRDLATGWSTPLTTLTSDNTTDPFGGVHGDLLTADAATNGVHTLQQAFTLEASTTYNLSVFCKENGTPNIGCMLYDGAKGTVVKYRLDTEDFGADEDLGAGLTVGNKKLDYYGNGWFRLSHSITLDTDNTVFVFFYLLDSADGRVFTTDAGTAESAWFAGVQLTKGATLYPYIGAPQCGFVRRGYHMEEDATNLITDSEDLTATGWATLEGNSTTETAAQGVGPDGLLSLSLVEVNFNNPTTAHHGVFDLINYTSGTDVVMSAFARAEEIRYVFLNISPVTDEWATVVFDLLEGKVTAEGEGATSGTVNRSGIIPCGNGLYRIWASFSVNETDTTCPFLIGPSNVASPTFTTRGWIDHNHTIGDGFYVGGLQVETGTHPSSYIATFGGTETRDADELSDPNHTWFTEAQGTMISEFFVEAPITQTCFPWVMDDTSGSNDLDMLFNSGPERMVNRIANSVITLQTLTWASQNGRRIKNSFAWDNAANDQGASRNGNAAVTASFSSNVSSIDNLDIGHRAGSFRMENCSMRTLAFWDEKRDDETIANDSQITDDGTGWIDEQMAA